MLIILIKKFYFYYTYELIIIKTIILMESSKKRDQFAVSIRRKQVSQKLEALRSQYQLQTQSNYQKYFPVVQQIINQQRKVEESFRQLRIVSYPSEGSSLLFKSCIHHKIYQYMNKKQAQLTTPQYNEIVTILINLCVHVQLDIPGETLQIVVKCILRQDRQIISLWFIANIIYQKSTFSGAIAKQLIQKCDAMDYMQNRIKRAFANQGDIVIFNFFCSAFLIVSCALNKNHVEKIFTIIEELLKYQPKYDQNFWYLTEALVQHGSYIGASDYCIFRTGIIKVLGGYCKSKKTKYVKNYLKMLLKFVRQDNQSYERLLKHQVFIHLSYCVENRFPQVKKLCAEIAYNLLNIFGDKVDTQNIAFFSQLLEQTSHLEKLTLEVQIAFIRFYRQLLTIKATRKLTKQARQRIVTQILTTNIIKALSETLTSNINNSELIKEQISFIQLLVKIDESRRIITKCQEHKIIDTLQNIVLHFNEYSQQFGISNKEVYQMVSQFLDKNSAINMNSYGGYQVSGLGEDFM